MALELQPFIRTHFHNVCYPQPPILSLNESDKHYFLPLQENIQRFLNQAKVAKHTADDVADPSRFSARSSCTDLKYTPEPNHYLGDGGVQRSNDGHRPLPAKGGGPGGVSLPLRIPGLSPTVESPRDRSRVTDWLQQGHTCRSSSPHGASQPSDTVRVVDESDVTLSGGHFGFDYDTSTNL